MKIFEAIDLIREFHQPYVWNENTRDTLLCGDLHKECTGICVTCCATYEIIRKCAENNINLIITHEGITYNFEKKYDVKNINDEIVKTKLDFASEKAIAIWRDHDAMHGPMIKNAIREKTDLIFYGIMKETGWEKYCIDDIKKPLWYKFEPMSAENFGRLLIDKWNLNGLRIIGDLNSTISTVYFCEHVNGGERDIPILENCRNADAIIPLEICDYTVSTYVRDAIAMNKNKVLFEMGHFNVEELGMKYMAELLNKNFESKLPVVYMQSGDQFGYMLK